MAPSETVAVLGAGGIMGRAIARNLARAGFQVHAWNRSREKAEPLANAGVQIFDSPQEAVQDVDVILTILADAAAVLETVDGTLDAVGEDAIWLQLSTIGEEGTERCAQLASDHDIAFVDAPVLGTKQPAEQGELVIIASGPEQVRDRLAPLFDVLGKRTLWLGEAGTGTRLKIAINGWILAVVEGGAETLALAQGMGLDPALVLEAVQGGPLDLPYLRMKGQAMIERNFEPSFRLELAAKDAALVEQAAERHGLDLPVLRAIRERLEEGVRDHGDQDMSATFLTSAPSSASQARSTSQTS